MKKKIIVSSVITVVFALIMVTYSFIALVNVREINKTSEILSSYNRVIINSKNISKSNLQAFEINGVRVRFTVVDSKGNVIFDTYEKESSNYSDRPEVKEAFEKGQGSIIRYSNTEREELFYFATKINDDFVIRSSLPIDTSEVFTIKYMKYYIAAVTFVLLLSIGLSFKLVKRIIYPLKELELVTSKIAKGDLTKRAVIYHDDEIGSLAKTFNDMASQLQNKMYDSIDKQNKLEAILESMESGVIAIDYKDRVMLINPYAKRVFNINENIIGKSLTNYISDNNILEFVNSHSIIETKEVKVFNSGNLYIRIKKAPIINIKRHPIGVVITLQDITDIKNLESIRSQFVANVSHELKTPLTSIKGFAETLKVVEDDFTRNKFLNIINAEAERLTRLINDILVLSEIENNFKVIDEELNIVESIENVINIVRLEANQKGIEIEYIYNDKLIILGDKDKFVQLMLNLIENAIKYSENNTKVTITSYSDSGYIYIKVIDKGIGIPKEDLPRIFERFYRVDKSRGRGGTGLGLAIVKHIVKLFNGEIYVESEINKGTTFVILLKKNSFTQNCEC